MGKKHLHSANDGAGKEPVGPAAGGQGAPTGPTGPEDATAPGASRTVEARPDVASVISEAARAAIVRAIDDNNGGEVFFVGKLGPELIVEDALPCAFGNDAAVPAITEVAEEGDVVIHNHPSGGIAPSSQDVEIASAIGSRSVGFYIVDNACEHVHVVVAAFVREQMILLEPDRIDEMLGREGALARNMDAYEYRPQQIGMARLACRAFNEDAIAIVEAGTGTGKSMAYLLPSVLWATENKDKVVVSTNTINLQEQLIHKDLPFLGRALGVKFKAALVKGRGNYVCLRKLQEVGEQAMELLSSGANEELKELVDWARATKDGSLSDLTFKPDRDLWDEVKSESESCLRTRCPKYRDCFHYRARRHASSANVLVVNHALLLTDLALRLQTGNYSESVVLPSYHRLVLDEGHNVEDAATRAFSSQITATGLRRLCRRWANPERRGRGVLSAFLHRIQEVARTDDPQVIEAIQGLVYEELRPGCEELAAIVQEIAERLVPALNERLERNRGTEPASHVLQLRITEDERRTPLWTEWIEPLTRQLHGAVAHFVTTAQRLDEQINKLSKETRDKALSAALQVQSHTARMAAAALQLAAFLAEDANTCVWMEYAPPRRAGDPPILRWCSSPIELGPLLKKALFDPTRTVIVTSATMTVDEKFDYMLARLGVGGEAEEGDLPAGADDYDQPYADEDMEWDPDAAQFADEEDGGRAATNAAPSKANRNGRRAGAFKHTGPAKHAPAARPSRSRKNDRPLLLDSFPSPFNYREQALVAAPRDVPDPRSREYEAAVADCVERAVRISGGGAFVLFTSYGMLNRTAARVEERLRADGFTLLRQGETARHLLIDRFKKSPKAVLFATSSFWEGVDVQGDALVLLILARLPFSVPSEPVLQARVEAIEKRGGNSFAEFSIPSAVIRFKQGFGRLIRSRTDRGAVLILDSRVVRQFYGRAFLNSLPAHDTWKGPVAKLWPDMQTFFAPRT